MAVGINNAVLRAVDTVLAIGETFRAEDIEDLIDRPVGDIRKSLASICCANYTNGKVLDRVGVNEYRYVRKHVAYPKRMPTAATKTAPNSTCPVCHMVRATNGACDCG